MTWAGRCESADWPRRRGCLNRRFARQRRDQIGGECGGQLFSLFANDSLPDAAQRTGQGGLALDRDVG